MMYIPDYYGNRLYGLPLYPIGFYTENETNSMTGKLTALTCEGTSHFMVNEGTRPSGSDSGWQECSTEPGAIQFKLADAREGIHILKVWMKKSATEIKSDPILLPLVYNTTAPLPPVVKLESANPSASSSLTLTLGVCDGTHVLVSEAAVVPSASDSGWMGCRLSGTAPYSLQNLTPGAHSLFVWSKDRAGNVSKTPSSVTVTYSP
jgi:hypothetical protein